MPDLEKRIESIPVRELLRKIVSKDSTTIDTIQELNNADSEEIKKQIAFEKLKNGEYVSAVYYFRENNGENDQILVDIANGLISKYNTLVDSGNFDPGIWSSQIFHAGIAISGIKNEELRNKQAIIMGDRIYNEIVKKRRTEKNFCAMMYSIAKADDKLIALADDIILNHRSNLYGLDGSDLKSIFQSLSDFKLFEKQIKKTINHFIREEHYDGSIVKDLIYATHPANHQMVRLSKKEIINIADFALTKKYYPLFAELFKEHKTQLKNYNIEEIADRSLNHELKNNNKFFARNLYYVEKLYESIKIPKEKILILAKRAERKNEFSFAIGMYERLNDKKYFKKLFSKMQKRGYFDNASSLIWDYLVDEKTPVNSIQFQKPFYELFMSALIAKNKDYKKISLFIFPEIIKNELQKLGDAALKIADDRHDIYRIEDEYIKTERILTKQKIIRLSRLFKKNGEYQLSSNLEKIVNDKNFEKDRFYLVRDKNGSKLYYLLRDYFDNKFDIEKSKEEDKERYIKYNENNLNRIKKFGAKDKNAVKEVLEKFSPYTGSKRLNKLAKRAFEIGEYDDTFTLLKTAGNTKQIEEYAKILLRKKEFDYAQQYFKEVAPEYVDKIISKALMKNIVSELKKDPSKGLDMLITLSENNKLGDIKLGMTQDNFYEGMKAKQVSRLSINSDLLDSAVIVKIEQSNPSPDIHDTLEYDLLKNLKIKNILLPKPIIYGKVNDLNVNVISVVDGKDLLKIISEKDKLRDTDYEFLQRAVNLFGTVNENMSEAIKKLSDKLNYENLLIKKQEHFDLEMMQKVKEMIPDSNIGMIYNEKLSEMNNLKKTWCKDNNATNILYVPEDKFSFIDFNLIEYRPKEFDLVKFVDTPGFLTKKQRNEFLSRINVDKKAFNLVSEYLNLRHFISRYAIGDIDTARFFAQRSGIKEIISI